MNKNQLLAIREKCMELIRSIDGAISAAENAPKSNIDESMVFTAIGEGFDFEVELKTLMVGDSIMIDGYSGVHKIISIGKENTHIQASQGGATIPSNSKVRVQKSVSYRG